MSRSMFDLVDMDYEDDDWQKEFDEEMANRRKERDEFHDRYTKKRNASNINENTIDENLQNLQLTNEENANKKYNVFRRDNKIIIQRNKNQKENTKDKEKGDSSLQEPDYINQYATSNNQGNQLPNNQGNSKIIQTSINDPNSLHPNTIFTNRPIQRSVITDLSPRNDDNFLNPNETSKQKSILNTGNFLN